MMPYTIKAPAKASIKIQRSEFFAFLFPVEDSEAVQNILHQHQIEYSDATHNCYAYILGFESEIQHYSDAGEPGGTAGKPILNSLLRNELTGVLAIVTRYYGGIKLGVKGLIEAYTAATTMAVESAKLTLYQEYCHYQIQTEYSYLDTIRHQVYSLEGEEEAAEYSERALIIVKIPASAAAAFAEFLDGYKGPGRLEYHQEEEI
ncbi:MAG: IMPACT family protein [Candidatus Cloacimonetes bacterium]|jgi:uncharacterized YigZ family protein|nr:IMPACT family protein [Candidatus Cloacimonadota bacterium]